VKSRNAGLDLLRALAVILVIGRHFQLRPDSFPLLTAWQRGGWVGVDLFFVLSGYLISGLLFGEQRRRGAFDVKRFLIRRGFKIYPAFWLMTLVTVIVDFSLRWPMSRRALLADAFFVQNYFPGLWGHTWSLAVEEHFYLAVALFLPVMLRRSANEHRSLPLHILAICIVCLALRGLTHIFLPTYDHRTHLYLTHLRADALAFGVLLSYLAHFRQLHTRTALVPTSVFVLSGTLLLAPAFIFPLETTWWIPLYGLTLFYLGSGCLVLAAARLEKPRNRLIGALATIGASSYSIYLWHLPISAWGSTAMTHVPSLNGSPWMLAAYIAISLGFGFLMGKAVEYPCLRLRERLFPARPADLGPATDHILSTTVK
jgi:peptidoglycan/LPS O-acetylase OafA/YrhL